MSQVNQFDSLTKAITSLQQRGFTRSFKISNNILETMDGSVVNPEEVTIAEYHRFEGESNPDDMSVIYAIETSNGLKGVLIDAYGTYSDESISEFLKKVRFKEKDI